MPLTLDAAKTLLTADYPAGPDADFHRLAVTVAMDSAVAYGRAVQSANPQAVVECHLKLNQDIATNIIWQRAAQPMHMALSQAMSEWLTAMRAGQSKSLETCMIHNMGRAIALSNGGPVVLMKFDAAYGV